MKAGWEVRPLGEVCRFKPPKAEAKRKLEPTDDVSFVPMNDLGIRRKRLDHSETRPLSKVAGSYTYFADGDVLLAKITPCFENGKLGIARDLTNGVGFGSSEFVVMRPEPEIDAEYLFYFLCRDEFRDAGANVMSGAVGHKRVPKEFVETLPIPLPPLEEQRRIVAVLDAAHEALDRARANIEANLADVEEALSSVIESKLEEAEGEVRTLAQLLSDGWIAGHLDGNHGSDYPRKEEFVADGVPYISANCFTANGLSLKRAKFLTPDRADKIRKGIARNGDVIFAHNATVGPVDVLRTDETRVILGTSLTYYRCNPAYVTAQFLAFSMRSQGFKRQYETVMRQSTRNQVPITKQREFTHRIPTIEAQETIAALGREVETGTACFVSSYERQFTDLADLRQSLLAKAFRGELT